MDTVINIARLLLITGLGFFYFSGLGWLAIGPLLQGSLIRKKKDMPLIRVIPLLLLSGLTINYALVLIFQSLTTSLLAGSILSFGGAACLAIYIFRDPTRQMPTAGSIKTYFVCAFICLLFLGPILADPLNDWDARSIWFFHAKMIYSAGSIGLSAGWQHPSLGFMHADYPNLIPAVAAQVSYVMGFWNEYLPKISLYFMLVPAVGWLFTFARRSFSFAILLLLIPFGFSNWLWNGYMDGYVALYFSIAVLLLGRYVKSSNPVDLFSSVCCFIVLLSIKNEGALGAIAGLGSILLVAFLKRKHFLLRVIVSAHWKFILAAMVALIPFVLWTFDKQQWNLQNDLDIGKTELSARIFNRISDGSYKQILKSVFVENEGALLLLGMVYCASVAWNKSFPREGLPALLSGGIFAAGMVVVYLLTPSDLSWHLSTSIERTMLSVSGCIFVGSYFMLNSIENKENVSGIGSG